ncbi:MAG: FAD-binding oxidoreductase [Gammaproteobacteria bacterium]|nr:FAD-binding oxidoreductase [Gammaproteobacteria bacterium]
MDLNSGLPFWLVKNGLLQTFPRLGENLQCDVLVVGAGITGALIADELTQAGMNVCVIDRREAGWGSTSASTALLQYEIDTELQALSERYGLADALLAYKSCEQAIHTLAKLTKNLRGIDFQLMQSLYFASHWYHKNQIQKEGLLRQANGFSLAILDRTALNTRFGIDAPIGLLSAVAAEIDPYKCTHRLLKRIQSLGGRIHARTALQHFSSVRGGLRIETEDGHVIRCKHMIIAAGYESQQWIDEKVASNRSSYAFISEPLPNQLGALKQTLIWESARPYLYLRRTGDERLLVGGEDDLIDIPLRRDARVAAKSTKLLKRVNKLFPLLPLKIAFAWAGTFAETKDGLPFFGNHEQHDKRVHFAMAYGGNGITYSMIGAQLLRATLSGQAHPCAKLFSFKRLKRG